MVGPHERKTVKNFYLNVCDQEYFYSTGCTSITTLCPLTTFCMMTSVVKITKGCFMTFNSNLKYLGAMPLKSNLKTKKYTRKQPTLFI